MAVNGPTEAPKQDKNDHRDGELRPQMFLTTNLPPQTVLARTGDRITAD